MTDNNGWLLTPWIPAYTGMIKSDMEDWQETTYLTNYFHDAKTLVCLIAHYLHPLDLAYF